MKPLALLDKGGNLGCFFIMGFLTVVAVNWREKSTMAKSVPQDLEQITDYIRTFHVTIEFSCFHESEELC